MKVKIVRCGETLPGFAAVRTTMVVALVLCQAYTVSETYTAFVNSPLWILRPSAYAVLFSLLGFALARSRESSDLHTFVVRRLKRIAPPLIIAVLAAILIIGPLCTTLSLQRYFRYQQTWLYLLNLIGWPRFTLPAVFDFNNLAEQVNSPLWASPVLLVTILGIALGGSGKSRLARFTPVAIIVLGLILAIAAPYYNLRALTPPGYTVNEFEYQVCESLVAAQLGVLAWQYKRRLRLSPAMAFVFIAALLVVALAGASRIQSQPFLGPLLALPTVYLGLFLATRDLPGKHIAASTQPLLPSIFLLSFPLQQTLNLFSPQGRIALANFSMSLPLTVAVAALIAAVLQRLVPVTSAVVVEEAIPFEEVESETLAHLVNWLRREIRRRIAYFRQTMVFWLIFLGVMLGGFAMTYFASVGDG